jgi:hypothetical protein
MHVIYKYYRAQIAGEEASISTYADLTISVHAVLCGDVSQCIIDIDLTEYASLPL